MIATIRLIDWLTVCGFYGVSTIFHPCKGGQQLDDNAVALHSTCASVLVSGGFVARETHTPIGILCCLTASIDAQIGEKTTFISCESSPFSTKFWVSLWKKSIVKSYVAHVVILCKCMHILLINDLLEFPDSHFLYIENLVVTHNKHNKIYTKSPWTTLLTWVAYHAYLV